MATGGKSGLLTDCQIVCLATSMSADDMASIAERYMSITHETIKNLQYENRGKAQAFNGEVIRHWANKNFGPEQVNVSLTKPL